jgi:hypothetical protein
MEPPGVALPAAVAAWASGGGERVDGRERKRWVLPVGNKKKGDARIRKRREERQLDFPKGLYVKSENCRDLFVKQNFPLI